MSSFDLSTRYHRAGVRGRRRSTQVLSSAFASVLSAGPSSEHVSCIYLVDIFDSSVSTFSCAYPLCVWHGPNVWPCMLFGLCMTVSPLRVRSIAPSGRICIGWGLPRDRPHILSSGMSQLVIKSLAAAVVTSVLLTMISYGDIHTYVHVYVIKLYFIFILLPVIYCI